MKLRPGLGLLTVAACCALGSAAAQNNLNNLGNINGANAIEESKGSRKNSSNNVLDSEELNSVPNNSSSKSSGESANSSIENIQDAENIPSNGDSLNGDLKSELNNAGNTNGLNNAGNANGLNNTGNTNGLNNANGKSNLGNTNGTLNPTIDPPGALPPPAEASAAPQNSDTPPPPESVVVDPNAIPGTGDTASSDSPQSIQPNKPKQRTRAERRQAQLELARKLSESIPPLNPGEGPAEYTVQPGDTLWDISDQLLDDSMWWPRLWVLNPEVQDPDKIEPGMKLMFYPSASGEAPELAIRDSVDPFGAPKVELTTLQTFTMNADRWTGKNGELIDPTALPGDQNLLTAGDVGMNATYIFDLPGFMSNSEIDSAGEVVSSPNSPLLGGKGQSVIAQFNGRQPNPGERFVALKHTPVLSGMDATKTDSELYNYVGVLGVVRTSPDGYTLMVAEEGNSHVSPTDLLVPFSKSLIVAIDPESTGRPNSAPAFVMATENGTYTHAGPGMAIFLQGINGNNPFSIGDDVELFMPPGGNYAYSDELGIRERVAVARIVETNADSAVGVILKAAREVSTGASTRSDLSP
jgi:nucleoid-associated protein YgaU